MLTIDNRDMREVERFLREEKEALRRRYSEVMAAVRYRGHETFEDLLDAYDSMLSEYD